MKELADRIAGAKNSNSELESLIQDYLPFIKKIAGEGGNIGVDYDDRLSLAMICFMNCVRQYEDDRGSFIAFAAACIRNRIIDEGRKYSKDSKRILPFVSGEARGAEDTGEDRASVAAYDKGQEQENLSVEIDSLSAELEKYGISFAELPGICPKQERARNQCIEIGRYAAGSSSIRETLLKTGRLAQTELAIQFGLSEKTIEKHRKYIVTIVFLLTGDYPLIRAFLPQYKDVRA